MSPSKGVRYPGLKLVISPVEVTHSSPYITSAVVGEPNKPSGRSTIGVQAFLNNRANISYMIHLIIRAETKSIHKEASARVIVYLILPHVELAHLCKRNIKDRVTGISGRDVASVEARNDSARRHNWPVHESGALILC